nr:EamA family transporter [Enterococcus sp. 665A]MBO1342821.1 EamA family transporter [Enterococcus sp. 665A]
MDKRFAFFLMITVSLAWGSSYLLMKIGLKGLEPFNLIGLRFGIAFFVMYCIFRKKLTGWTISVIK